MFFPLSTIKKFHVEIVFVAWLRDLSWEVKIVCLFLLESTSRKFLILLLFHLPVFYCKYRLHLLLFSLIARPFLHARASQPVGILERYLHTATQVPMFSPFSLFLFLFSFLHMYVILIPSARSLRFGSRLWKVNIDQNWNPSLSLLVSENPCYL